MKRFQKIIYRWLDTIPELCFLHHRENQQSAHLEPGFLFTTSEGIAMPDNVENCENCGHICPSDSHCQKCGGDPMVTGDRLCAGCDAAEREAMSNEKIDEASAIPVFGIYNVRLKAWAATKTDWNSDPTAADVMNFLDEQDANEFIAEHNELFDSAAVAAGFPEHDYSPLMLRS